MFVSSFISYLKSFLFVFLFFVILFGFIIVLFIFLFLLSGLSCTQKVNFQTFADGILNCEFPTPAATQFIS